MAGSIEKRGKNSYRLTVSEGFDLNGNPMIHRKTVHGTKKDAQVELAKFVTEVQNGLVVDGKSLRFSEFTEIWKRDYGSKELAPSTYKRYCRILLINVKFRMDLLFHTKSKILTFIDINLQFYPLF